MNHTTGQAAPPRRHFHASEVLLALALSAIPAATAALAGTVAAHTGTAGTANTASTASKPAAAAAAVTHPRLLLAAADGPALRARLAASAQAQQQLQALTQRLQPYVSRHQREPDWIVSRLQMYWQSHSTDVFIKNGAYDHAEGHAPVPTVRFNGTRESASQYFTPRLEDVKPYMGERDMLWLQNRDAPGQPWEWASQAKTGRIVEAINLRIATLARDAAFLYWYGGDERYARFAYDIFDTYMTGMAYRTMPQDLNRGHDQTLVGLQTFEVIHEDIIGPLTETYDVMHDYIARRAGDKRQLFDRAFKQWADVIVTNGVPWNNWNLIEARFLLHIAAILGPDSRYPDGHGSDYYVRTVLDGGGARQWALQRLMHHGYDATGMWNESPSYSMNVGNDFMEATDLLEQTFGIDALPQLPSLPLAATAMPQYLLPNGRTAGFGDTRYGPPRTAMLERLLAHATRHGQDAAAAWYASLLAALRAVLPDAASKPAADGVHALLASAAPDSASLQPGSAALSLSAWQTPTFHAPGPSWLIQRSGYQNAAAPEQAMAISQVGSSGNHAHANGIAMELFAKGLSLAPESGRGKGYLSNDHLEYYAQFAAHNTVVVDGVSAYPAMKSNHPFTVQAVYPAPATPAAAAFPWATFSDVAFLEPESNADQARTLGIVRLDDSNGYFVDIFRSRKRDGHDKYHDYIYHNLGQRMQFLDSTGQALPTRPSEQLSFADGDLVGYDYWRARQSLTSQQPLRARFELQLPQRALNMTAWLQGSPDREFFSLLAPPSTAWEPGLLPKEIETAPLPTLVVRQRGAAWAQPFTAVFEATDRQPAQVEHVEQIDAGHALALRVRTAGQRRQTIMSGDRHDAAYARDGQQMVGRYAIIAERSGQLDYLFLGAGRSVSAAGYALAASSPEPASVAAALWRAAGGWHFTASHPVRLQVPAPGWPAQLRVTVAGQARTLTGKAVLVDGQQRLVFDMPAMAAAALTFLN